jgi:dephospho-CoA kinase
VTKIFGLTGGIGSGKSRVAAHWRARGLPVVDADELAREVVEVGSPGLAAVVEHFGASVLARDGSLDRQALAARVFGDDDARRALNAITHPRVRERGAERFQELHAAGEPLGCYEVPLLVESGLADAFRPLVVVSAPRELQIERAARRDGATAAEVEARLAAQLPLDRKVALADHVIDNAGELGAALTRSDAVLRAICVALDVDPARYRL